MGGSVSHVLHLCFEAAFEAEHWSVISPLALSVNLRFTAFFSSSWHSTLILVALGI